MIALGGLSATIERGQRIATILRGAWRLAAPPLTLSPDDLAEVVPALLSSGAGAITWWRVRGTPLAASRYAPSLRDAYLVYALQDAVHQERLRRVVPLLLSTGVDTVLAKGWAAARLYPEPGLRPYGDIDLYVRPDHLENARAALGRLESPAPVDLHRSFPDFPDCGFDELYSRSRSAALGGLQIPLLAPEDHLHLLCLHLLRHGAWRPLWLCDVAALLESRPEGFDWDYFLSGNRWRVQATLCTLRLAHELLDARLDGTPVANRVRTLPSWVVPAFLREWGKGSGRREPLASLLGRPLDALREARRHWPNAVEATAGVRAPFNDVPRLPFQLAFTLRRGVRFSADLVRPRRQRTTIAGSPAK